jgi:hypothetical protein
MNLPFAEQFEAFWVKIVDSPRAQIIKDRFDQLDPSHRRAVIFTGIWGTAGVIFCFLSVFWFKTYQLKKQLSQSQQMLRFLREAQGAGTVALAGNDLAIIPTSETIKKQVIVQGLELGITLSDPDLSDVAKSDERLGVEEHRIKIHVKKVNLKQLVIFIRKLENLKNPTAIGSVQIQAQPDLSGYLDADLVLSYFGNTS